MPLAFQSVGRTDLSDLLILQLRNIGLALQDLRPSCMRKMSEAGLQFLATGCHAGLRVPIL